MRRSPTREQHGAITALYLDTLDIDILVVVDKILSMFFHVRLVDLAVYIYYRPLVSATLLGVGRRGGSSSRRFPAKTGTVVFPTIIIYFYKVYLNTLDICFRWLLGHVQYGQSLEGSAPILRFLFSLDISDVFGGSSEVVGEFSPLLPRDLASLFHLT